MFELKSSHYFDKSFDKKLFEIKVEPKQEFSICWRKLKLNVSRHSGSVPVQSSGHQASGERGERRGDTPKMPRPENTTDTVEIRLDRTAQFALLEQQS